MKIPKRSLKDVKMLKLFPAPYAIKGDFPQAGWMLEIDYTDNKSINAVIDETPNMQVTLDMITEYINWQWKGHKTVGRYRKGWRNR